MKLTNDQAESTVPAAFKLFRDRVELVDILLFLFVLTFVRQYVWIIQNNLVAWSLSVPVALILTYVYVRKKQFAAFRNDLSFWIIVALPLVFAYAIRAAFPDRSFDVLTYHLLHTERTLRGTLFAANDYFPSAMTFNPVGDTVAGFSRLLFGFRLGTIFNLVTLVATGQIVSKLLQPLVKLGWLRSLCVLVIILSENLLFEISTYLVDLLPLPLMLEATVLTLKGRDAENRLTNYVQVAVLLGISVACKLTNLAVVLPLLAICAYQMISDWRPITVHLKRFLATTLLMSLGFLASLVPFTIYIYKLTGNPVFPIANGFFQSPFWPTHSGWDNRFGPLTFWESIAWPIMILFVPERQSELAVYSGRITIGFLVAITCLAFIWRNAWTRYLCIIGIVSSWLWSFAATGNGRYGFYQETLAGVIVVATIATLVPDTSRFKVSLKTAVAFSLSLILIVQSAFGVRYFLNREWGGRTTLLVNRSYYLGEAKQFFRDRSLDKFLTEQDQARFDKVGVWFETAPKSTGLEVLLKPNVPVMALRQPEYFLTGHAWRQFIEKVQAANRQGMYSLCNNSDLAEAQQVIRKRGLEVGEVVPINLPFFSFRDRIGVTLIEIRYPHDPEARERFESTWTKAAFASADYNESIVALEQPPPVMRPGQKVDLRFRVKNLGSETWPATGDKDHRYLIDMGNRWIRDGIVSEDTRAVMSSDLPPGGETEMKLTVTAPPSPGEYTLEIDMVHEGVSWFKERGAQPLQLRIRVQP